MLTAIAATAQQFDWANYNDAFHTSSYTGVTRVDALQAYGDSLYAGLDGVGHGGSALSKFDKQTGKLLWSAFIEGNDTDYTSGLQVSAVDVNYQGVYIVSDVSNFFPSSSLVAYSHDGEQLWQAHSLPPSGAESALFCQMAVDNSGVYVSGVLEELNGSPAEIFVAKYDLAGSEVWNKTITVVDDSDVTCSHNLAINQLDTDDSGTVYFSLAAQREVIVLSNQGDELDRFSTSAKLTNTRYFDGYLYATQPLQMNDG